jgi:hypothetical protein
LHAPARSMARGVAIRMSQDFELGMRRRMAVSSPSSKGRGVQPRDDVAHHADRRIPRSTRMGVRATTMERV